MLSDPTKHVHANPIVMQLADSIAEELDSGIVPMLPPLGDSDLIHKRLNDFRDTFETIGQFDPSDREPVTPEWLDSLYGGSWNGDVWSRAIGCGLCIQYGKNSRRLSVGIVGDVFLSLFVKREPSCGDIRSIAQLSQW